MRNAELKSGKPFTVHMNNKQKIESKCKKGLANIFAAFFSVALGIVMLWIGLNAASKRSGKHDGRNLSEAGLALTVLGIIDIPVSIAQYTKYRACRKLLYAIDGDGDGGDGVWTVSDLARKAGVSEKKTRARIAALKKYGCLTGYTFDAEQSTLIRAEKTDGGDVPEAVPAGTEKEGDTTVSAAVPAGEAGHKTAPAAARARKAGGGDGSPPTLTVRCPSCSAPLPPQGKICPYCQTVIGQ